MTNAQKVDEWIHCWNMQAGDHGKVELMVHLKRMAEKGDKIAHEALGKIIKKWGY